MLKFMLIFLLTNVCLFVNVYPDIINKILTICMFYDNFYVTKT